MTAPEKKLLLYFLDQLSDRMSSAGCNDMDQSVFSNMSDDEKEKLKSDFDEWDKVANSDGYEVRRFDWIPDFCWLGFLESQIREENEK